MGQGHGLVTAASEGAECALVVRGASAESAPGVAVAQRLEDVEKVVRSLQARLDELEDYACEMTDRLLTRIEALEAAGGCWSHI